jgi:hypothetical protein
MATGLGAIGDIKRTPPRYLAITRDITPKMPISIWCFSIPLAVWMMWNRFIQVRKISPEDEK